MDKIEKALLTHPFVTPWYLQNMHMQTLFAAFFPYFKLKGIKPERKYIKLADGSQIIADCLFHPDREKHATVISVSGFEGYINKGKSNFAEAIFHKAYAYGYNVIHVGKRGEADSIHLTKSLFPAYPVDDMSTALQTIYGWGLKKFYLVGVSGGGWVNLFTSCKLEEKIKKHILGIVSISAPIDFFSTWEHAKKRPLYGWLLLHLYKNLVKRRIKIDPQGTWDMKQLKAIKSLRAWGEAYVSTFEKFSTIDEYHKGTDLKPLIPHLQLPTLIIHAKDDPIIPVEPYTAPAIQNNKNIITLFEAHGGHGGFFSTKKLYGDLDGHWAQNRAMEFIRLLENN